MVTRLRSSANSAFQSAFRLKQYLTFLKERQCDMIHRLLRQQKPFPYLGNLGAVLSRISQTRERTTPGNLYIFHRKICYCLAYAHLFNNIRDLVGHRQKENVNSGIRAGTQIPSAADMPGHPFAKTINRPCLWRQ